MEGYVVCMRAGRTVLPRLRRPAPVPLASNSSSSSLFRKKKKMGKIEMEVMV